MKYLVYNCSSLDHVLLNVQLNEVIKLSNERGKVYFAYCDGIFSTCQMNTNGQPFICKLCRSTSKYVLKDLPKNVEILPLQKRKDQHSENIKTFSSISELKKIKYKNVEIGYSALSFYISCTRNPSPSITNEFVAFVEYIFKMTIDFIDRLESIINSISPDEIQLYNGRQFQTRPLVDLAIIYKIPYICNEVNKDFLISDSLKIVHYKNSLPHDIHVAYLRSNETWEKSSYNEELKIIKGKSFFENRRNGIPAGDKVYILDQIKDKIPENYDPKRINIVIFNSSEDEFVALGSEFEYYNLFPSQYEGINFILDYFKNNPNYHFYLRIHPNLKNINYTYHLSLYTLEKQYNNISIIPPESQISSYALMDLANKVVVFGSTTGAEAAYWGKPVILLGGSFYYYFNICYIPKDKAELIRYFDQELVPKNTYNAIRYGFFILDNEVLAESAIYRNINPTNVKILNLKFLLSKRVYLTGIEYLDIIISIFLSSRLISIFRAKASIPNK